MGCSVSVGISKETDIYSYFYHHISPTLWHVIDRGSILHMCPSLWHQLWCRFGVATDDKSEDILLSPTCVMIIGWRWCCLVAFSVGLLSLLSPNCNSLWVCLRWSRKRRPGCPEKLGSCTPCCVVPSIVLPPCIIVHVAVWKFWYMYSYHTVLESGLVYLGSVVAHFL